MSGSKPARLGYDFRNFDANPTHHIDVYQLPPRFWVGIGGLGSINRSGTIKRQTATVTQAPTSSAPALPAALIHLLGSIQALATEKSEERCHESRDRKSRDRKLGRIDFGIGACRCFAINAGDWLSFDLVTTLNCATIDLRNSERDKNTTAFTIFRRASPQSLWAFDGHQSQMLLFVPK